MKDIGDLQERLFLQRVFESSVSSERDEGTSWDLFSGDYSKFRIFESIKYITTHSERLPFLFPYSERTSPEQLIGFEILLDSMIKQQLEIEGKNRPTIVLDTGCAEAHTLCRLANANRNEIRSRRLILIGNNLGHNPNAENIRRGIDEPDNNYLERVEFMKRIYSEKLIRFINSPFRLLMKRLIQIPNIDEIKLGGNVDILIDRYSAIFHTKTPEVEIRVVGKLLSNWGITFFDPDPQIRTFFSGDRRLFMNEFDQLLNSSNLYKPTSIIGLWGQEYPINPHLGIYLKPDAPKLRILDNDGRDK